MTLMVIVLCLLSERFLVHASSHKRYYWFSFYGNTLERYLQKVPFLSYSWVILLCYVLPVLLLVFLALHLFQNSGFGLVGFLINVIVFYGCIGPGNPFYPSPSKKTKQAHHHDDVGAYFVQTNEQLFAVMFWYMVLGPLMVLVYRLVAQARCQDSTSQLATWITHWLDWFPARMTALLLMLVGNFQAGLPSYVKLFFKKPIENEMILSLCGVQALSFAEGDAVTILQAEGLVEHAIIVLLVFLALFTLVAWM